MNKYKPEYLGKVIPVDNPPKMTDMLQNQFESFSKIYDTCKDQSESITDLKVVENPASKNTSDEMLSVKVSADLDTITKIQEKASSSAGVTVEGNVISAIPTKDSNIQT